VPEVQKMMKARRAKYYRLEKNKTVTSFIRTLSDFCEAALSEGREKETKSGPEWVVGDLQNTAGDSCYVNLTTGQFYDHATGQGGGPNRLWAGIFGIDPGDQEAILAGMEAWITKGELPDGSGIGDPPEKIIRRKKFGPSIARSLNNAEETAKWARIVKENRAEVQEIAKIFAEYRGLSVGVFEWLINSGYVAISKGPWLSKKHRREFWDPRIVFPVCRRTETGADFYGMHTKWFGRQEHSGWEYVPDQIPALPLIIGDLPAADLVVLGESTWDIIAFIDLYELHTWSAEDGVWAAMATRGAANVKHVPFECIKPEAWIKLLRQNDAADLQFVKSLPGEIRLRAKHITPPDAYGYKDLNDWMRDDSRESIKWVLENRI
jgi:hypothetical protein